MHPYYSSISYTCYKQNEHAIQYFSTVTYIFISSTAGKTTYWNVHGYSSEWSKNVWYKCKQHDLMLTTNKTQKRDRNEIGTSIQVDIYGKYPTNINRLF